MDQRRNLIRLLRRVDVVTEPQLTHALRRARTLDRPLDEVLLDLGYVTEEQLLQLYSRHYDLPRVERFPRKPDPDLLDYVPGNLARRHCVLPLNQRNGSVRLAVARPPSLPLLDDLKLLLPGTPDPLLTPHGILTQTIRRTYGTAPELNQILDDVRAGFSSNGASGHRLRTGEQDNPASGPAARKVQEILRLAHRRDASDIHFEPSPNRLRVRLRIDSVLQEIDPPPLSLQRSILARIKVLADMDVAERRRPQDGRFTTEVEDQVVEYRCSTLTTVEGENLVLRQLENQRLDRGLDSLGMTDEQRETFQAVLRAPHGMILNTGPTGCGKTTTLFSGLNRINAPETKILTLEDPVEYDLPGTVQTQVDESTGYTFARGLRALLRQDPDVLLVGEIRDEETARVAVEASLTGHRVFSTLHTNRAATGLLRLGNLGVEPFLLRSCVRVILAQRLVRRTCGHCRERTRPEAGVLDLLGDPPGWWSEFTTTRGAGCDRCGHTGYRGRTGLFELLEMTDRIRTLCERGITPGALHRAAARDGMTTMLEHGWETVRQGQTTPAELVRVLPLEQEGRDGV